MTEFKRLTEYRAILKYGKKAQKIKAAEECAELIQAIAKDIESDGKNGAVLDNIAEEIADVSIMLEQLIIIYGNKHKVDEYIKSKIQRLHERIGSQASGSR